LSPDPLLSIYHPFRGKQHPFSNQHIFFFRRIINKYVVKTQKAKSLFQLHFITKKKLPPGAHHPTKANRRAKLTLLQLSTKERRRREEQDPQLELPRTSLVKGEVGEHE